MRTEISSKVASTPNYSTRLYFLSHLMLNFCDYASIFYLFCSFLRQSSHLCAADPFVLQVCKASTTLKRNAIKSWKCCSFLMQLCSGR